MMFRLFMPEILKKTYTVSYTFDDWKTQTDENITVSDIENLKKRIKVTKRAAGRKMLSKSNSPRTTAKKSSKRKQIFGDKILHRKAARQILQRCHR
ncbi:MAG: hypothetical protein L6V93_13275 [Clostridiales bacterium]|nr:MAG: hypothetical protein L6V93_13275 [Clostridiales bacterium]